MKTLNDILTPAEFRMVELLGDGCRNKEIANQFHTTEQVVKNRFHEIFNKVGCASRHELAMRFIRERPACTLQSKDGQQIAL